MMIDLKSPRMHDWPEISTDYDRCARCGKPRALVEGTDCPKAPAADTVLAEALRKALGGREWPKR